MFDISRALGLAAPSGAEKPSAYEARPGVRRNWLSVCPVVPKASTGRTDGKAADAVH